MNGCIRVTARTSIEFPLARAAKAKARQDERKIQDTVTCGGLLSQWSVHCDQHRQELNCARTTVRRTLFDGNIAPIPGSIPISELGNTVKPSHHTMILNKLVALATLAAAVTDVEAGTHVRRAVHDGEDMDATQRDLGFLSSSSGKGKGGSKGSSTGGGSASDSSGSKTSKSSKSSGGKGGSKGSSSSSDPSKSESSSSGGDLGGGNTGESASGDGGDSTGNSASGSGTSRPTDFVLAALEENNKVRIARYERNILE